MEHELRLLGPVVSLGPLRTEHAAALADLGDESAYAWHTSSPLPLTVDVAAASIETLLADPTTIPLAVTGTTDGVLRGITSFYELNAWVPRVEVGHTFYGRRYWGGETNPHTKMLMLTQAFEEWACERVALRCDAANARSAGAIERLGARPEGVLRSHRRRHDGTVADTAYFSIVRAGWPDVRRGLVARTSPTGGTDPVRARGSATT
jgi:N-acetyltransferase